MRALMRARGQPGPDLVGAQHDSSAAPLANGVHDSAEPQRGSAAPAELPQGSAKRKRAPAEDPTEGHEALTKRRHVADISLNGQAHDRRQQPDEASEQDNGNASLEHSPSSLTWQCQRSCQVSIAGAAWASASLAVAPSAHPVSASHKPEPDQSLPSGVSALPQLKVTLQRASEKQGGRQDGVSSPLGSKAEQGALAVSAWQPRCHVTSEPELPESACQELAAMAGENLHSSRPHYPAIKHVKTEERFQSVPSIAQMSFAGLLCLKVAS